MKFTIFTLLVILTASAAFGQEKKPDRDDYKKPKRHSRYTMTASAAFAQEKPDPRKPDEWRKKPKKVRLYTMAPAGDDTTAKPVKPVVPAKPNIFRAGRRFPAANANSTHQATALNTTGDRSGKKAAARPDAPKKPAKKNFAPTPGPLTAAAAAFYGNDQARPADPQSQTGSQGRVKSGKGVRR